jgi:hypothetical protein
MSMDFHPSHHTLLLGISMCIGDLCQMIIREYITAFLSPSLTYCVIWTVGSVNGEITLWELISRERLFSKPFKIWDLQGCSLQFQVLSDILFYCTCINIFSSQRCSICFDCKWKPRTFVMPSMWWQFFGFTGHLFCNLWHMGLWSNYFVGLICNFLQASGFKDASISVTRVAWSPDGNFVGM